jgi:hypothetical protein
MISDSGQVRRYITVIMKHFMKFPYINVEFLMTLQTKTKNFSAIMINSQEKCPA